MKMNAKKGSASACRRRDGFTLIELLVVVAVIGLLASITMGYLTSSKNKGNDAGVKTNLRTVANQAELFYLNNNSSYLPLAGGVSFIGVCPTSYNASGTNMFSQNKTVFDAVAEAVKVGNGGYCANSSNNYAVAVGLKLTTGTSWCIDSSGAAKLENLVPAPASAINPTTFLCY